MTTPVSPADAPIDLIEGEPYALAVTVEDATTLWPGGRQVYAEIRQAPGRPLLVDLTTYITTVADPLVPSSLVVTVTMNGADTRDVAATMNYSPGEYDIWIAEPGLEQATAVRIARGRVSIDRSVSAGPA